MRFLDRTLFAAESLAEMARGLAFGTPDTPRKGWLALALHGKYTRPGYSRWSASLPIRMAALLDGLRKDMPEARAALCAIDRMLRDRCTFEIVAAEQLLTKLGDQDAEHYGQDTADDVGHILIDVAAVAEKGRGRFWAQLVHDAGRGLPLWCYLRDLADGGHASPSDPVTWSGLAEMCREQGADAARLFDELADVVGLLDVTDDAYRAETPSEALGVLRHLLDDPGALAHIDRLIDRARDAERWADRLPAALAETEVSHAAH